ncbi:MAG TPA: hypothetical protein PKY56_04610 [Candidatus Kapabacteria bacterium]|nr:hypothetical protein [Candidatus Kapabacteria bacterium]HPO63009.1 hypothetical protein [Candidatus Kapabacteria bacterium]
MKIEKMKNLIGKHISIKYKGRTELIMGLLIDFNEKWALLKYNVVDYVIDGYIMLKVKKIKKIIRNENNEFTEKVLLAKGLQITNNDKYPLINFNDTLKFISEKFGVIHIEIKDENVCNIGRFLYANEKEITIQEIGTRAEWIENETFKFKDVWLFEFDTDYCNSLVLYNKIYE